MVDYKNKISYDESKKCHLLAEYDFKKKPKKKEVDNND